MSQQSKWGRLKHPNSRELKILSLHVIRYVYIFHIFIMLKFNEYSQISIGNKILNYTHKSKANNSLRVYIYMNNHVVIFDHFVVAIILLSLTIYS